MENFCTVVAPPARLGRPACFALVGRLLLGLLGLLPLAGRAQAPAWAEATPGSLTQPNGTSQTRAVATDASGNVFVTGNFTGQVAFGGTLLTSRGANDLFVAKYVPATGTWAWAQSGGGANTDIGYGVAVSGSSVYVTGQITNNAANASGVLFGGTGTTPGTVPQYGASATSSTDLVLAKYTDNGTTATLGWTQVGGGINVDYGQGVAVSGSSVYVTGQLINNTANANGVLFGGTGTTPGTVQVNGASSSSGNPDLVLAKYTDNGTSATLGWTQVGGGTGNDIGFGVAVSGTSVYVAGQITNTTANANLVLFGGTGTTAGTVPQYGASSGGNPDLLLAKYTDNGPTATLGWTQVGGGTSTDVGQAVAVSGTSVYVAGQLGNNMANASGVLFGGTGTTPGTAPQYGATATNSADLVLAKYTDNGATATLGWTQVGGGTGVDIGYGVAASGSSVYVTGQLTNTTTNANLVLFGGTGPTPGTVPQYGATATSSADLVLAKYTDNGTTATLGWTQVGGGTSTDIGYGVAVSGSSVYVTGQLINNTANASGVLFGGTGPTAGTTPVNGAGATSSLDLVLARYADNGATATLGWTQVGGGTGADLGYGVAVSGQNVVAGGSLTPSASFGSLTVANPLGGQTSVLARVVDPALVPPTSLTSVSPAAELPGQVVTLTGTGFTAGSTVSFGGTAATGVTVVSATQLTATVPAGLAAGSAPVSVTTGGSISAAQPFGVLAVYDGGPVGSCTPAVPATASVGDGAWHYLLSAAGQVVAAYNYSGASLGDLAIELLQADPAQPVRRDPRTRAYLDRNWHLSNSAGRFDGRSVQLRLYGLAAEQARLQAADAAATLAGLKATQYSGANEDCELANNVAADEHRTLAAPATQPAGTAYFVAELTVADHFSEFYLTGSAAPLPVELAQFTATAVGASAVRLAWTTASEKNSRQFDVERSFNGTRFAHLGTVAAAGNSSSARAYGFDDTQDTKPLSPQAPIYYRLKQVDLDGTFSYSPVRVVRLAGAADGLALYPNPASAGSATLLGAAPGTPVTVLDALGRPVATATADAAGTAALRLPAGLPAGVYVVRAGSKAVKLAVE